ncbi:MAG: hypothetical protein BWY85_00022 [Firmicutes bacterium ADurb.Bin506]|nr:MAG: hypothetical protein BWY85_00022 [Firmicutes bacterium ADurb.Bin506]
MNPDTGHAYMIPEGMHAGTNVPIPDQWAECARALIASGTPLWHPSHPFDDLRKWAIANLSPEGKATMDAYMAERCTTEKHKKETIHTVKKSGKMARRVYTQAELDEAALADVRVDLKQVEERIAAKRFSAPWTARVCRAQATKLRRFLARYARAGAHNAVLNGKI